MIRKIVFYGDPVLREKCSPVEKVDKDIKQLAQDMLETMEDAQGIGLAAPQIGIPIQLAVIDVSFDPHCISYLRVNGVEKEMDAIMPLIFINPQLELVGEKHTDIEGCLSFPELRADIKRPYAVRAHLQLLSGESMTIETDGLLARALQHETDHLHGILFIDRVSTATKLSLKRKLKQLKESYSA